MSMAEGSGALRAAKTTEHRAQVNQWVILAVLAFFLWQYAVQQWRIAQAIKIESIDVSNPHLISPNALCPGDTLLVGFDADVKGFGIVILDSSTQLQGQPTTFSQAQRVPVDGPVVVHLVDTWKIPERPDLMANGSEQWVAGDYERLETVSASTSYVSRFIEPRKFTQKFSIRANCPGVVQ